jgi:hypothetical protein
MPGKNWQPIQTAPRDKDRMLLWAQLSVPGSPHSVMIGRLDDGMGWVVDDHPAGMIQIVPTHWMPLPEGPNSN